MSDRLATIDPQDPLHPLLLDALRHVWTPARRMAKAAAALPPARRGLRFHDPVRWQEEL